GQPFPARVAQDGGPAPHAARLSAAHEREKLQGPDREAQHPPLNSLCAWKFRALRERMHFAFAFSPAAKDAAGIHGDGRKGSSGRPGKVRTPWQDRQTLLLPLRGDAQQFLAVLLMASGLAEKHERKKQCSIFIELNSIGVGVRSLSRQAR